MVPVVVVEPVVASAVFDPVSVDPVVDEDSDEDDEVEPEPDVLVSSAQARP